jgi:hypothetical protein
VNSSKKEPETTVSGGKEPPVMKEEVRIQSKGYLGQAIQALRQLESRLQIYHLSISAEPLPIMIRCLKQMLDFHEKHAHRMTVSKFHQKTHQLWEKLHSAQSMFVQEVSGNQRVDLSKELLQQASVLFCTLSVSGRRNLLDSIEKGSIDVLIVDEAGQSVEAETLIPLQHHPKKILLVGDTKQLPATVLSDHAKQFAYDRSMMQRLEDVSGHIPIATLTIQYRMHPSICAWPSKQYYGGHLEASESVVQNTKLVEERVKHRILQPIAFFDILSQERYSNPGNSRYNEQEVENIIRILQCLATLSPSLVQYKRIGIISFYAAQVERIQRRIEREIPVINSAERTPIDVIVHTVDGFQGDECDIIILSFVCANKKGNIGFLSDVRRLNVAITRAKHHLIMLGNYQTLSRAQGSDVQTLVEYLKNEQKVFTEEVLQNWLKGVNTSNILSEKVQGLDERVSIDGVENVENLNNEMKVSKANVDVTGEDGITVVEQEIVISSESHKTEEEESQPSAESVNIDNLLETFQTLSVREPVENIIVEIKDITVSSQTVPEKPSVETVTHSTQIVVDNKENLAEALTPPTKSTASSKCKKKESNQEEVPVTNRYNLRSRNKAQQ